MKKKQIPTIQRKYLLSTLIRDEIITQKRNTYFLIFKKKGDYRESERLLINYIIFK